MFTGDPAEFQFLGLYLPPLFVAIAAGLLCSILFARLLNRTQISRFFWHPPLTNAALWLLATALIALFIIAP